MPSLQPALVFKDEATQLNSLYWTSRYSYRRTAGMLKLISETGSHSPDPRVNQLWGASEIGESSVATRKLSDFIKILDNDSAELRSISILKICSAFENALCGYFYLCCLYDPQKELPTYPGKRIPDILKHPAEFEKRKIEIKLRCDNSLHGKYTKRLNHICDTWGLARILGPHVVRLNSYYEKRHLIAHDQSLAGTDSPEHSSTEIINTRITINEASWKCMISDFSLILDDLDEQVSKKIVRDGGLSLAIYRIIDRDGPQMLSDIQKKLSNEWRMGNLKAAKTRSLATTIGRVVKQLDGNKYKIS